MTIKLNQAFEITLEYEEKLKDREWDIDLAPILYRASDKIEKIADEAIHDLIAKIKSTYVEEATAWATNSMTDINGNPIKLSSKDLSAAKADLESIKTLLAKLENI